MSKRKGKIVAPVPEATSHLGYNVGDVVKCKVRKMTYSGAITDIHLKPSPCFSLLDRETGQYRVARFEDITEVIERTSNPTDENAEAPEAPSSPVTAAPAQEASEAE
jgi:hypothetical protein